MDLSYPPDAEAFRREIRDWIAAQLPPGWSEGTASAEALETFPSEWNRMLHETGWSCPMWPEEYGGRGVTTVQAIVWAEELARVEAPIQPPAGGELLVGPTLLHWGDRTTKAPLPPGDRPRPRDLVPGLLRTRSRLRPGVAADERGARRGRVGDQRPQDLDEPGPGVRLHLHAGPHQSDARPSTAGSPTCWSRPVNQASKSVPSSSPTAPRGSARCSSPTPAARRTTSSAGWTTAGRWRCRRSASSGAPAPRRVGSATNGTGGPWSRASGGAVRTGIRSCVSIWPGLGARSR